MIEGRYWLKEQSIHIPGNEDIPILPWELKHGQRGKIENDRRHGSGSRASGCTAGPGTCCNTVPANLMDQVRDRSPGLPLE